MRWCALKLFIWEFCGVEAGSRFALYLLSAKEAEQKDAAAPEATGRTDRTQNFKLLFCEVIGAMLPQAFFCLETNAIHRTPLTNISSVT